MARALVGRRSLRPQLVHASSCIGIMLTVESIHRQKHRLRPLRRRGVIQPRNIAPHNGKLPPNRGRVESTRLTFPF